MKLAQYPNQLALFTGLEPPQLEQGAAATQNSLGRALQVLVAGAHPEVIRAIVQGFADHPDFWRRYSDVRFISLSPSHSNRRANAGVSNTFRLAGVVAAAKRDLWNVLRAAKQLEKECSMALSVRFGFCSQDIEPPGRELIAIQAAAAIAFEGTTYVGLSPAVTAPARAIDEILGEECASIDTVFEPDTATKWLEVAVPGRGHQLMVDYAAAAVMGALCPILQRAGYSLPGAIDG